MVEKVTRWTMAPIFFRSRYLEIAKMLSFFLHFFIYLAYDLLVIKMLKKILLKTKIPKEYLDELKIIYLDNELKIYNYEDIVTIDNTYLETKKLKVYGKNLKLIYVDKVLLDILGSITKIEAKD